jgi:hypothetical protein
MGIFKKLSRIKFHLIQTGNLRVEVKFAANVTSILNCVVYAVFDNMLKIDKQREVSIDDWTWMPFNWKTFWLRI